LLQCDNQWNKAGNLRNAAPYRSVAACLTISHGPAHLAAPALLANRTGGIVHGIGGDRVLIEGPADNRVELFAFKH
jgi:hypothetical protein